MKVCINCYTENPIDAALCSECGMSLRRAATGDEAVRLKTELEAKARGSWKNYNQGIASYELGEYQKAIADCTEAIRIDPSLSMAYSLRGEAHLELGEHEQAIADYTEAIRIDPDDPVAYRLRRAAHLELGEYERVIRDCGLAIRRDPTDADAYCDRGLAQHALGHYLQAISDLTEALRLDCNSSDAHNGWGLVHYDLGQYQKAIDAFTEVIRLDPSDADVYCNRGLAQHGLGRYREAIDNFTEAVRLDPDHADAYYNRALAHREHCSYGEVIADCTEVVRIDPSLNMAYSVRGAAHLEQGGHEQAIDDCSEAIRLEPDSAEDWHHRGIAQYQLGEYHKAIDDYTMVIHLDPDDAEVYHERGLAHSALGEHEEAIADFTEAIRPHPHHALAYYNRGLSHSALGERDEAIEDYTIGVRIDPGFATDLADMVLTSPDLPSAFKEEVKAASRRKKWRSRKGPELPLTASGLVYLFGEEFADPREGQLAGSQTQLVRSGQTVGSASLALKLFEAAVVSLAEEGYITLRMEQRKDRLGVTTKVVTITEKKSGDDLPRSLEKEIMGVVRGDPKENGMKAVVERVIPESDFADAVKWTVSYVIEVLSEAGYLDWVLRPGSLFAYEVHRWADEEAVAPLAEEVDTLKTSLRAFASVDPYFCRRLAKAVRAGFGPDTAWLELLLG